LSDVEHEFHESTQFEAIYGIYHFLKGSYIALLVESEVWVSVPKINIRKTKKIIVVPLFQSEVVLSESQQSDEKQYLELLQLGFKEHGFYYSADFDLTHSQQRLAKLRLSKGLNTASPWKTADSRFFWNLDVVSDLIACAASRWIVPFMSAHIEVRPDCVIGEHSFTLLFVSRRSRYNQGCRFFKRGIDQDGNVANFVETEQARQYPIVSMITAPLTGMLHPPTHLPAYQPESTCLTLVTCARTTLQAIFYGNQVVSVLLTRGSVPVFWGQPGLNVSSLPPSPPSLPLTPFPLPLSLFPVPLQTLTYPQLHIRPS